MDDTTIVHTTYIDAEEVTNFLSDFIAFKALNEGSVPPSRQSSRTVYKVTEAELGCWIDNFNRNFEAEGIPN